MTEYVYRWSMRPENDLMLELQVTAPSVIVARREIERFLVDHAGRDWSVERVSRELSCPIAAASARPSAPPRSFA